MRHSAEYRSYLRSPAWSRVRQTALRGAGYRCEHCGKTKQEAKWLEVNHKHYRTPFGQEQWPRDLEALCHACHKKADRARRKRNGLESSTFSRLARWAVIVGLWLVIAYSLWLLWR